MLALSAINWRGNYGLGAADLLARDIKSKAEAIVLARAAAVLGQAVRDQRFSRAVPYAARRSASMPPR